MRIRELSAAVLLTFGLAAGGAAASGTPADTPDPAITDGSAQQALDQARTSWRVAHVQSYRVRVARGCFCPEELRTPRTITVRHGSPLHPPSHLKSVATVPRMFRVIQDAINHGVAGLTVSYGKRGVPRSITVDVSRFIADEEQTYTIDRFQRLP